LASLIDETRDNLPVEVAQFITNLSMDGSVIPNSYLFPFELEKLSFNIFGTLKDMNQLKSEMIYGFMFFARGLMAELMLKPAQKISNLKEKDVKSQNLYNFNSVMYAIFLSLFNPALGPATESSRKPEPDNQSKEAIILDPGLMNSDQHFMSTKNLDQFFYVNEGIVSDIQNSMKRWLDIIYDATIKYRQDKYYVRQAFKKYHPNPRYWMRRGTDTS